MSDNILEEIKQYGLLPYIPSNEIVVPEGQSKSILLGDETEGLKNMVKLFVPGGVTSIKWNGLGRHRFSEFIVSPENKVFQTKEGVLYTNKGYDRDGGIRRKHMMELVACPTLTQTHTVLEGTKRISNCAFKGCLLSTLILPNSLEEIGTNAFYMTQNLKSIILPQHIRLIEPQSRESFIKVVYDNHEFASWSEMTEYMLNNGFIEKNHHIERQK